MSTERNTTVHSPLSALKLAFTLISSTMMLQGSPSYGLRLSCQVPASSSTASAALTSFGRCGHLRRLDPKPSLRVAMKRSDGYERRSRVHVSLLGPEPKMSRPWMRRYLSLHPEVSSSLMLYTGFPGQGHRVETWHHSPPSRCPCRSIQCAARLSSGRSNGSTVWGKRIMLWQETSDTNASKVLLNGSALSCPALMDSRRPRFRMVSV
mmetsp:Transcript_11467/g.26641  ORF Transcript_11467/g.26641 Transcript_11467/m.26641 type:complete len:208 (-) Transcript_11467:163-786(-)